MCVCSCTCALAFVRACVYVCGCVCIRASVHLCVCVCKRMPEARVRGRKSTTRGRLTATLMRLGFREGGQDIRDIVLTHFVYYTSAWLLLPRTAYYYVCYVCCLLLCLLPRLLCLSARHSKNSDKPRGNHPRIRLGPGGTTRECKQAPGEPRKKLAKPRGEPPKNLDRHRGHHPRTWIGPGGATQEFG